MRNRRTRFSFRVVWSGDDREFVGLCAKFPSLSWLAASRTSALAGIVNIVRTTIRDMRSSGEPVPAPLSPRGNQART